ncbi:hypothetical protein EYZ11_012291 [Aspergillus tanneri]|uniref:Clr5 domain-containing protein n=1 Tax=Aspergillus tanneri TaxID=1220188 RepID=A0A4S3J0L1_9EURO|nr:uncharacterized protein ATNIH1004_000126 [Aspergillus tanneri]KAA8651248.1 hypothetical protein ATNIH1004_000126 [Aspergillus tanneri]THC88259.1 hypothetical protein EYZ11_012291 [Aspergillus tanneri]
MKSAIPSDIWETKRVLITKLYKEEEWPLKQVMKALHSADFRPSETQLRSRLKKWNITKPSRKKWSPKRRQSDSDKSSSPKSHPSPFALPTDFHSGDEGESGKDSLEIHAPCSPLGVQNSNHPQQHTPTVETSESLAEISNTENTASNLQCMLPPVHSSPDLATPAKPTEQPLPDCEPRHSIFQWPTCLFPVDLGAISTALPSDIALLAQLGSQAVGPSASHSEYDPGLDLASDNPSEGNLFAGDSKPSHALLLPHSSEDASPPSLQGENPVGSWGSGLFQMPDIGSLFDYNDNPISDTCPFPYQPLKLPFLQSPVWPFLGDFLFDWDQR